MLFLLENDVPVSGDVIYFANQVYRSGLGNLAISRSFSTQGEMEKLEES